MNLMVGAQAEGIKELRAFKRENIGNAVGTAFPKSLEAGLEVARFCRENRIHFIFSEVVCRDDYELPAEKLFADKITTIELEEVIAAAGEYYHGRMIVGESGGMLYWPHEYLREPCRAEGGKHLGGPWSLLPQDAKDMAEAKDNYSHRLKDYVAKERKLGGGPLWDVDSSMVFKYHLEAGIDVPYLEMMPGDAERMCSVLRGTARAADKGIYGALIAFGWYGGGKWDELYFRRWQASLYYSYLAGLKWIISESGHFGFDGLGNDIPLDHPQAVRFRGVMREFAAFCENNPRPESGPEVRLGFVLGNLDGDPGLWSNSVWGQYENGAEWRRGDAEKSWELLDSVYRRAPWNDNLNLGAADVSGQPPLGLYDIVPIEAPPESLGRYSCLVMLGWNTMTGALYDKLSAYVENGGHLIASLAHLGTNVKRGEPVSLVNGGDLRRLFGVVVDGEEDEPVTGVKFVDQAKTPGYRFPDWSSDCDPKCMGGKFKIGKIVAGSPNVLAYSAKYFFSDLAGEKKTPVLIEHRPGKGAAFLVNAFEYPGSGNMTELWRLLIAAAARAEQPEGFQVVAADKIRYAVYSGDGGRVAMLLNTDFDLPCSCRIVEGDRRRDFTLAPLEFKQVALAPQAAPREIPS